MSRLIAGCVPACFSLSSPFAAATDGPPSDKADADAVLEPIVVTGSYAAHGHGGRPGHRGRRRLRRPTTSQRPTLRCRSPGNRDSHMARRRLFLSIPLLSPIGLAAAPVSPATDAPSGYALEDVVATYTDLSGFIDKESACGRRTSTSRRERLRRTGPPVGIHLRQLFRLDARAHVHESAPHGRTLPRLEVLSLSRRRTRSRRRRRSGPRSRRRPRPGCRSARAWSSHCSRTTGRRPPKTARSAPLVGAAPSPCCPRCSPRAPPARVRLLSVHAAVHVDRAPADPRRRASPSLGQGRSARRSLCTDR